MPSLGSRRLVRGGGRYVDDLPVPDALRVAIVRSPHAHARIRGIDPSQASATPGVVDVVTGEEIRRCTNPIPQGWDPAVVGAKRVMFSIRRFKNYQFS